MLQSIVIRPKENYQLLGTSIILDKNKTYIAEHATNQPNWISKGKIFVEGMLLEAGEYDVISPS